MKKNLRFAVLMFLACAGGFLNAQPQRYLDEVFSSVNVTYGVTYAQNISVLTGSPTLSYLVMDVYEPDGDTLPERPLVLVLHTGSFLPAVFNGQPTGDNKDSATVEMCMRFAKRGYVAAAVNYRLGWNPLSSSQETRTGTLINAAYRGVQDAHTCVRYFRKDAATNGNVFKVDVNRIAVGGIGTGGYISLAYAYFDKYTELEIDKFIDFTQNPPFGKPYIDTAMSGDFQGTLARPLNNPSNLGYSSDINMVFNCGGALGDSTWLEAGDVPVVAFHCTNDPNAPYTTGAVIVPTTGDFVVEASGSYDVIRRANNPTFGDINSILKQGAPYTDVYSARANQVNDGFEGLFPFITPAPQPAINCNGIMLPGQEQGAPWDWWDEATYKANATAVGQNGDTMACNAKRGNPDMSAAKGKAYIDTIQGYLAPRMFKALNIWPAGIQNSTVNSGISVYPNPSNDLVNITSNGKTIKSIDICNIAGQLVKRETGLSCFNYSLSKKTMTEGIYFIKVETENNNSVHKVVIY